MGVDGRWQDRLSAAVEINRVLLTPTDDRTVVLQSVADAVVRLAEADVATVVLPAADDPGSLEICVVAGLGAPSLRPLRYPRAGTLDLYAMTEGSGVLLDAVGEQDLHVHLGEAVTLGAVMALPLVGAHGPRGVVVVGRTESRPRFTRADLDLADGFAAQAALALELADVRAELQRLVVVEERNRIARDLHDHVVQRLYASGLSLQSALAGAVDEPLRSLLVRTVDDLGDTIRQVRTSIFALTDQGPGSTRPRAAVLEVVRRVGAGLPTSPRVTFRGPVDTAVDDDLAGDLLAVVGEGLTNVVRHAEATVVEVDVRVVGDRVRVAITDDGVGMGGRPHRSGLGNLAHRAHRAGGTSTSRARPGGGHVLVWDVPLTPDPQPDAVAHRAQLDAGPPSPGRSVPGTGRTLEP